MGVGGHYISNVPGCHYHQLRSAAPPLLPDVLGPDRTFEIRSFMVPFNGVLVPNVHAHKCPSMIIPAPNE